MTLFSSALSILTNPAAFIIAHGLYFSIIRSIYSAFAISTSCPHNIKWGKFLSTHIFEKACPNAPFFPSITTGRLCSNIAAGDWKFFTRYLLVFLHQPGVVIKWSKQAELSLRLLMRWATAVRLRKPLCKRCGAFRKMKGEIRIMKITQPIG